MKLVGVPDEPVPATLTMRADGPVNSHFLDLCWENYEVMPEKPDVFRYGNYTFTVRYTTKYMDEMEKYFIGEEDVEPKITWHGKAYRDDKYIDGWNYFPDFKKLLANFMNYVDAGVWDRLQLGDL